ncbi:transposase [Reichenbachiella sp. MALMAid0571]|uniref:transposase n=1 Tax=Reichenbachiella sp. MALMAid0571 TaxID=3143939 RepID=UPI0032DEC7C9
MQPEACYHIYNHANGSDNLFQTSENYRYFLQQWAKYIEPIARTHAYCLMPNHFHALIRIRSEGELERVFKAKDLTGFENLSGLLISKAFSNLFNSYAKAYNKQYDRRGSLFNRPFKAKEIPSDRDLAAVTHYIHSNPVHHGFVRSIDLWKWSSYHTLLSTKPTLLERNETISWFGNRNDFLSMHQQAIEIKEKEWID